MWWWIKIINNNNNNNNNNDDIYSAVMREFTLVPLGESRSAPGGCQGGAENAGVENAGVITRGTPPPEEIP